MLNYPILVGNICIHYSIACLPIVNHECESKCLVVGCIYICVCAVWVCLSYLSSSCVAYKSMMKMMGVVLTLYEAYELITGVYVVGSCGRRVIVILLSSWRAQSCMQLTDHFHFMFFSLISLRESSFLLLTLGEDPRREDCNNVGWFKQF